MMLRVGKTASSRRREKSETGFGTVCSIATTAPILLKTLGRVDEERHVAGGSRGVLDESATPRAELPEIY